MSIDKSKIISYRNTPFITNKQYRVYPNFPIEGVNFVDVFSFTTHFELADVCDCFNITEPIVLLPEARGFLFYNALGPDRVLPLRKEGKLPGELFRIDYTKEYGADSLFFQKDRLKELSDKWSSDEFIPVALFDDVLATGGTASCIVDYLNNLHFNGKRFRVTNTYFYIEIVDVGGRSRINSNVNTLYQL